MCVDKIYLKFHMKTNLFMLSAFLFNLKSKLLDETKAKPWASGSNQAKVDRLSSNL